MTRRLLFSLLLLAPVYPAYQAFAAVQMSQATVGGEGDGAPTIDHQAVACAQANRFPRLEARFSPADAVASAQILFQGENRQEWFAVSMKAEGAAFAGILPQPKSSLKEFRYYIEVTDRALRSVRTVEYSAAVVEGAGSCKDGVMATSVGSAKVVLKGPVGGATLPAGFAPLGVFIAGASTTGAAGAAVGGGGGLSTGAIAGIVGGVGAAAGIAVAAGGGGGETRTANTAPTCTPGPVTSSLANAPSTLRCGQALSLDISVSNGTCSALNIQTIVLTRAAPVTPTCQGATGQVNYNPAVTTLAPGQSGIVLPFRSAILCCTNGPCIGNFTCPFNETFSVQTSAGTVASGTAAFVVSYDPTCPVCP